MIAGCAHGRRHNCECYEMGVKDGIEQAVENAWRSTMAETQYRQIEADRNEWKAKYEELVARNQLAQQDWRTD